MEHNLERLLEYHPYFDVNTLMKGRLQKISKKHLELIMAGDFPIIKEKFLNRKINVSDAVYLYNIGMSDLADKLVENQYNIEFTEQVIVEKYNQDSLYEVKERQLADIRMYMGYLLNDPEQFKRSNPPPYDLLDDEIGGDMVEYWYGKYPQYDKFKNYSYTFIADYLMKNPEYIDYVMKHHPDKMVDALGREQRFTIFMIKRHIPTKILQNVIEKYNNQEIIYDYLVRKELLQCQVLNRNTILAENMVQKTSGIHNALYNEVEKIIRKLEPKVNHNYDYLY